MKRIMLYTTVALLVFAGCNGGCRVTKPKNLRPIDWAAYNDAYTVYYHLIASDKDDIPVGKTIKVAGWIRTGDGGPISAQQFSLGTDSINTGNHRGIPIQSGGIKDSLQAKLDICDLTKKCYIKGKIRSRGLKTNYCTTWIGIIIIENIDDIYFEGERRVK